MELLVVLVIGCCALLVVLVVGLVGLLGVLGVTRGLLELAVDPERRTRARRGHSRPQGVRRGCRSAEGGMVRDR